MVAAMWGDSDHLKVSLIQIPIVLYTTEQIFFAQLLVYAFKRWIEKDEKNTGGVDQLEMRQIP